MKVSLYIILISILLSKHYALSHMIRKRQLFREQVLPHAGGKIPDSAFLTDRLALNRLQKDGIAVPDGVLLEQRQYQVYPHQHRTARPTFRVVQTPDNRYISPEGEYSHNALATVDTTYLIPHAGDKLLLHDHPHYRQPHYTVPKAPILKEFRLPNYALFNFDYKKKKAHVGTVGPNVSYKHWNLPLKLDGGWPQRLPQEFVSYHAAVGNGHNYPSAHSVPVSYGSDVGGSVGTGSGWNGGWVPSTGGSASGESFAPQPLGSFEDYYSQLNDKHRFYRNVGERSVGPSPAPKPSTILHRDRQRDHPQRHQA
ncbi:uncharacterized protein LOC128708626 [Anopheles marshallii]|uniref:uncharacterized protein LOC128708626 n=1 Tax=Anopheles marshallii TaxID=1521116 RepID=UPI00237A9DCE|nr:uncharacterized protein LOC128708626 [Anopheles marshallii]